MNHAKDDNLSLALAYYHTVQPALTHSTAIDCLFSALAEVSISEAFHFYRNQPEFTQKQLFEMLISSAINEAPSVTIADRGSELASLPLNSKEETWLEDYVLTGDGKKNPNGKSTWILRKISMGQTEKVGALKSTGGKSVHGLDWNNLIYAAQKGLASRAN